MKALSSKNLRAGAVSQNERALKRGRSISFLQTIRGRRRFPSVPIKSGMTEKKIMTKA